MLFQAYLGPWGAQSPSTARALQHSLCAHPASFLLPDPKIPHYQFMHQPAQHASKVMLKLLQARLQQYVNRELPDIQAGFRKGRGPRDQIADIHWIMEIAREFQKDIYFCFIDYAEAFDCVDHKKLEKSERDGNTRPPDLPLEKSVCRSGSNS